MLVTATHSASHAQTRRELAGHHDLIEDHWIRLDPLEEVRLTLLQSVHKLLVKLGVVDHTLPDLLEVRVIQEVGQATCALEPLVSVVIALLVAVSTSTTGPVHSRHLRELLGRDHADFEGHIGVTLGQVQATEHVFAALARHGNQVSDSLLVVRGLGLRRLGLRRLWLGVDGLRLGRLRLCGWLHTHKWAGG